MLTQLQQRKLYLVLALVWLAACTQNALQTAAEINGKYADGLAAVQKVARSAHETKKADGTLMLSDENYGRWLNIAIQLNQGGKEVNNFLRAQATLDPTARAKASSVIHNLAAIVQDARSREVVKLDDPGFQQQMQMALDSVQLALNAASIALSVGGN